MSVKMSMRSYLAGTAAVALLALVVAGFWLLGTQDSTSPEAALGTLQPAPATLPPEASAIPTTTELPIPTPSPAPTPTPTPTPLALSDVWSQNAISVPIEPPLAGCSQWTAPAQTPLGIPLSCADGAATEVVAAAGGRVVHVVDKPSTVLTDLPPDPAIVRWIDLAAMGPHVVVDHGGDLGPSNTQTVYAGLASIDPAIRVGAVVTPGGPIGSVAPRGAGAEPIDGPQLWFSVWVDGRRSDGRRLLAELSPQFDAQLAAATVLGAQVSNPTDPACSMVLFASALPGASRAYRNGIHQGIDFGCGAAGRFASALASGTVVYLVDDYQDPPVPEREALLAAAGRAADTPAWTLAMLYGNVVVIDHGELPEVGRVVTISAHLEAVDPAITLGAQVVAGQRLGEIGNRGTNAASEGLRGAQDPSLHLHWELHIDGWYLGQGLAPGQVVQVIRAAMCGSAATPGCPPS